MWIVRTWTHEDAHGREYTMPPNEVLECAVEQIGHVRGLT